MKISSRGYTYFFLLLFICSCSDHTASFTSKDRSLVRDSVLLMTASISKDLSQKGPIAWLSYFENTPDFFMVSDGQLVFPNIDTAKTFIQHTLINIMPKIELSWSHIQIDPLTDKLAGVSAVFHEDITDAAGKATAHDGYFTAIASQTPQGWKLHNAHWSSLTH